MEIGRTLIRMRPLLGRGHFLSWIEHAAGLSRSAAYRAIAIAEMVDAAIAAGKLPKVGSLRLGTLGEIAARHTDPDLRDEILTALASDAPPTNREVAARIAKAKSKAARPERRREITRGLETAPKSAPEPADRTVTPAEAGPIEAIEDAAWPDVPSASHPPTPAPEVETPAVAPAVPARSRRLSQDEIGPILFKVAEHLRDAGLAEDIEAVGDLIGDEELGRCLRAEIRGERPDATISASDTEATDAARPFSGETT